MSSNNLITHFCSRHYSSHRGHKNEKPQLLPSGGSQALFFFFSHPAHSGRLASNCRVELSLETWKGNCSQTWTCTCLWRSGRAGKFMIEAREAIVGSRVLECACCPPGPQGTQPPIWESSTLAFLKLFVAHGFPAACQFASYQLWSPSIFEPIPRHMYIYV